MSSQPEVFGVPLKYVSLVTLVVQNSALVLVMRGSRVFHGDGPKYYPTTAVFLSELAKFIFCLYMSGREQIKDTGRFSWKELYYDIFSPDAWKLMIPATLYTIQNNLQYIAADLLDAATFQVTYQLKILTTALCSVIMLNKILSGFKWFSLVMLTIGVALVSVESSAPSTKTGSDAFTGLAAVTTACVISGLAGVYFEKILKGTQASVWVRNVQLSFFSLFPALFLGVLWKEGDGVLHNGFFYGYNILTVSSVACQAFGGIIVALVVKYADNILKGFATSISIILSCVASVLLFNFRVTYTFVAGAFMVLSATYLYSKPDKPKKEYIDLGTQLSNVNGGRKENGIQIRVENANGRE